MAAQFGAYFTPSNERTNVKKIDNAGISILSSTLSTWFATTAYTRPTLDMVAYPYSYRVNNTPYDDSYLQFSFRATTRNTNS